MEELVVEWGNSFCVLPSRALVAGGALQIAELDALCTNGIYAPYFTADLDGDGLGEWFHYNQDWRHPLYGTRGGAAVVVPGFDIPWDDPTKW